MLVQAVDHCMTNVADEVLLRLLDNQRLVGIVDHIEPTEEKAGLSSHKEDDNEDDNKGAPRDRGNDAEDADDRIDDAEPGTTDPGRDGTQAPRGAVSTEGKSTCPVASALWDGGSSCHWRSDSPPVVGPPVSGSPATGRNEERRMDPTCCGLQKRILTIYHGAN